MSGPRFDPELPPELQAFLPTIEELIKGLPDAFKKTIHSEWAVLDENGDPQPVGSLLEWAMWSDRNPKHRQLGLDEIKLHSVSTVFLGLNHQHFPGRPPLWFETMVFGPPHRKYYSFLKKWQNVRDDLWMRRCATRIQALKQHAKGVKWLKAYLVRLEAKTEQPK